MKRIIAICVAALFATAPAMSAFAGDAPASYTQQTKKDIRTVIFATNMRCGSCVKKVKENLSFAKGVKALDVSLEKQQITVTYDAAKTSVEELAKIVNELGYKAEVVK